jgi:hypothetical protein
VTAPAPHRRTLGTLVVAGIATSGLVLSGLMAGGCAQGGGGGFDAGARADSGTSPIDATVMRMDGGGILDSGPDRGDAGPVDSGPIGVDSGPVGVDSGPIGVDSGPTGCTSAAECDDGVACNGVERCELGACVAGAPAVCDDAIACTVDRCLEPTSGAVPSCNYTPDDARCATGQICGSGGCISTCGESPCRLVTPQCGCPGGQSCYLSGATRLCSATGASAEGTACTGVSSCASGLICINVGSGATPVNECHRFCDTDSDCVGTGSLCAYTLNDGTGGTVPGVRVCSRSCSPVAQTGCAPGTACHIFRESMGAMRYFFDCAGPVGTGGRGASCAAVSDCRAGFACVGTPGTCQKYCAMPGMIGAAGGCSSGEACYGFTTPLRVGATEYGVCDLYP